MKRFFFLSVFLVLQVIGSTAQKAPLFSFGVITDVQYYDGANAGSRYYKDSPDKLSKVVTELNAQPIDFVINLGDLIDRDWESFEVLLPILDRLKAPVHHVLGNHDFSVAEDKINLVAEKLSMPSRYYGFQHKSVRFLFLDGNDQSVYGQKKGSKAQKSAMKTLETLKAAKKPNAKNWNGGIGKQQLKWLTKQLEEAKKAGEIVIVNCHFPVAPVGSTHNLWNDDEVRKLLSQYPNVKAWLNGHNHVGGYEYLEGIHYVNFKGMVEKKDMPWAVVEVYEDHLIVNGYQEEPDRLLYFSK